MRTRRESDTQARRPPPGHCPRLGRWQGPREHEGCPYCFGRRRDIALGNRRNFCDFQEGRDPVCFGFPETCGRHLRG